MKWLFGKKTAKGIEVIGLENGIFYAPRKKLPFSVLRQGEQETIKWLKGECSPKERRKP